MAGKHVRIKRNTYIQYVLTLPKYRYLQYLQMFAQLIPAGQEISDGRLCIIKTREVRNAVQDNYDKDLTVFALSSFQTISTQGESVTYRGYGDPQNIIPGSA